MTKTKNTLMLFFQFFFQQIPKMSSFINHKFNAIDIWIFIILANLLFLIGRSTFDKKSLAFDKQLK